MRESVRYSRLKILRYPEKLRSLPPDEPALLAPLHVRLKPTNRCNHACAYCAYRSDALQLGRDMDPRDEIPREKLLEIVDDLVAMGVGALTLSGGGEPLLHPDLPEALDRLAPSAMRVACLTNGSRLSGGLAERLAFRASWVRVSIDGWDGESYARIRGCRADEFDRVMGNLRAFKALGGPCTLGAAIVVDAANAPHVGSLIDRLRDAGVDSVKVSPCIVSNDGAANNRHHAPHFRLVRDAVQAARGRHADGRFELFDAWHEVTEDYRKPYRYCPYIQILPVIGADLRLYACHDKAYNLACGALGSLRDTPLRDLWFADKARLLAIDPSRDCDHHCEADGKNRLVLEWLGLAPDHLPFV